MNRWKEVKFLDLLEKPVRNGIYKKKEFHGAGVKIVNMGELFAFPRLMDVQMKRLSLTDSEKERYLLRNGDLLFARRSLTAEGAGKCSLVYEICEETTFESSIIQARPDQEKSDSSYLYYFFNSPFGKYLLRTIRRQVAVAGITGSDLMELEFNIPPLPEQKAIADVLSSLDDKIDLLQRQNKTLEQLAQTLFRQWFIEEAQDEWMEGTLESCIAISSGKGLSRKDFIENGSVQVMGANGEIGRTDKFLFNERLIFTGRVGTLGNVFISNEEVWLSDNTLVIKPKNENMFYFIYFLLKESHLEDYNVGSTQPLIRQSDIKSIELVIPSKIKLNEFEDFSTNIFSKINANLNQIRTLETLRDTLLPKLISGEVRVCYESFPVQETIKEPYLPWLENAWLAILEVVYRISKQPYANHIGQTIFQKVCYIMTEETGLPLRLQYEQGDFGPFSKQITPVLQKLSKEKFVKKHSLGKMDEILLTQNYEQHRDNFLPIIAQFEDNIQKTVDLFCRIKNTEQAEEVATVLYAARQLLDVNAKNKVSEQQVLDFVLGWKPQWQEESKRTIVGSTIRNLGGLGWLDLEYCDSLPDEPL